MTRAERDHLLALWDSAVAMWRLSDRACISDEFTEAEKSELRGASVKAALEFVSAAGGIVTGVAGPAAIALGWA